jgi:uncharacterized protein
MGNNKKIIFSVFAVFLVIILYCIPLQPVAIGKKIILVEKADDPHERAQGLKGRSFLAKDGGMLFCFESQGYPNFWMKDTLIPLDIAFIADDHKIVDIQQMVALDEKPRYAPKSEAKYALEMNAGWFKNNGISIGDKVFFW